MLLVNKKKIKFNIKNNEKDSMRWDNQSILWCRERLGGKVADIGRKFKSLMVWQTTKEHSRTVARHLWLCEMEGDDHLLHQTWQLIMLIECYTLAWGNLLSSWQITGNDPQKIYYTTPEHVSVNNIRMWPISVTITTLLVFTCSVQCRPTIGDVKPDECVRRRPAREDRQVYIRHV